MSDEQPEASSPTWQDVLIGGMSSTIDGWVTREFSHPEILPPQPAPDRTVQPTGFQIDQKTLLIAGGVLALVIIVAVVA